MPIIVVGFAGGRGKSRTEKGQETEEGQGRKGSSTTANKAGPHSTWLMVHMIEVGSRRREPSGD